jgi:hypothetical protein
MRSYEFESPTTTALTPERARLAALKKQKDVASMAIAAERKRQTIAKAQKQFVKASATSAVDSLN